MRDPRRGWGGSGPAGTGTGRGHRGDIAGTSATPTGTPRGHRQQARGRLGSPGDILAQPGTSRTPLGTFWCPPGISRYPRGHLGDILARAGTSQNPVGTPRGHSRTPQDISGEWPQAHGGMSQPRTPLGTPNLCPLLGPPIFGPLGSSSSSDPPAGPPVFGPVCRTPRCPPNSVQQTPKHPQMPPDKPPSTPNPIS